MTTAWKRLYGPITAVGTGAVDILTAPANLSYVITKFTISNVAGAAALATIAITPSLGAAVLTWQRTIPGIPTTGSCMEVTELEGQILAPGDKITFTSDTANALAPMISGVGYTS